MRITEKIIRDGEFWLPSDPENKISGTLTISDGGETELEILKPFGDITEFNRDDKIPRIVGFTNDGDGYVTLNNCFYLNKVFSFGSVKKSRIFVNNAILGACYSTDEEVTFNRINFSVEGLDTWLGISGMEFKHDKWPKTMSIKYVQPDTINITSIDGIEIKFAFMPNYPLIAREEIKIKQEAYIQLTSKEEKPWSDFISVINRIHPFFCFAMDEIVCIKNVMGFSETALRESNKEKNHIPVPLRLFYQSQLFSFKEPKPNFANMLFLFTHIEENLETTFNNWFKIVEQSVDLYFLSKIDAYKYMEGKFLSLTQGLEVYHRETYPDSKIPPDRLKLKKRLKDLLTPFKNFFGGSDGISEEISAFRNYFTHYNKKYEHTVKDANKRYSIYLKTQSLFQLLFLKRIGFSDEKIKQIAEDNYRLKQKLDWK